MFLNVSVLQGFCMLVKYEKGKIIIWGIILDPGGISNYKNQIEYYPIYKYFTLSIFD